jgi:hypothetical protein
VPNFGTIGDAIADRYAPGVLSTPGGSDAIRSSSANLPNHIGATPAVLVFLDAGQLTPGNGTRIGVTDWLVRLYYDQVGGGDLERDLDEIRDWLTILVNAHQVLVQLGGAVVWCRTVGFRVGILEYAGVRFTGAEIRVQTGTSESWTPTA